MFIAHKLIFLKNIIFLDAQCFTKPRDFWREIENESESRLQSQNPGSNVLLKTDTGIFKAA